MIILPNTKRPDIFLKVFYDHLIFYSVKIQFLIEDGSQFALYMEVSPGRWIISFICATNDILFI